MRGVIILMLLHRYALPYFSFFNCTRREYEDVIFAEAGVNFFPVSVDASIAVE